ncbi:hypothetical protein LZ838_03300 [Pseudomonas sp. AA27]|uniref:hypothetical protein n=1 Tax=Pseudomonas sp. AA27 TaxID=2908652 RepID=UPI001F3CE71F|nr:hypothetical protein [Pseudomonas sp. AA27]MCF1486388.1 hypothetical protein [Pseudomonas sp. AA27]
MLGTANITTKINEEKIAYLDSFWASTGLLPIIDEDCTGISTSNGKLASLSNFCPEVTFTYFGYYASYMTKYADEIDREIGCAIAEREKIPNDWRFIWATVTPCHFTDCKLYSQTKEFNTQKTATEPTSINKIYHISNNQTIIKESHMGDQYNITGQTGAIGPNSKAENNTFNQILQQSAASLDLPVLATELSSLREAMRTKATDLEHDQALVSVGAAEKSARQNDGGGALKHLKSAGEWAFDVATKIGTTVAAKAIQTAIDL